MNMGDELKLLHRLREATKRVQSLQQDLDAERIIARTRRAEDVERNARLQSELDRLRGSALFRVAAKLRNTARNPRLLAGWPAILMRLARGAGPAAAATHSMPAAKPVLVELKQEQSAIVGQSVAGEIFDVPAGAVFPDDISQLRIALVSDRFTADSLALECQVVSLQPDTWVEQISDLKPHLLFVESAWMGLQGEWQGKVVDAGADICSLVMSCRHAGLPTVFWNKEDPLHFEAFLEVASLFDWVFTTDADSISNYQRKLGHDRVGVLPFAVQPHLHHPFASAGEVRREASFFAGAWYGNLSERCQDFSELADALALAGAFCIHDRNDLQGEPNRRYPDRYSENLRPAVLYDKTPDLYRGYRIGLTLNTIKQSSTMFARRALELMCTNTSVYSNYSRALGLLFGDLVRVTDDGRTTLDWAWDELHDPDAPKHRHRRLLAMRKVLAEYTWSTRLTSVLSALRGTEPVRQDPRIVVVCQVSSVADALRVQQMARSQRAVNVELWLAAKAGMCFGDEQGVLDEAELGLEFAERFKGSLVSIWCATDTYGPHYLGDLAAALKFGQGQIVGKGCYFRVAAEGMELIDADKEYCRVDKLQWRRALGNAESWSGSVQDVLNDTETGAFHATGQLLSIDRESYAEGINDALESPGPLFDSGVSIASLEDYLREVVAVQATVPVPTIIDGGGLLGLFDCTQLPEKTSLAVRNNALEVVSKLPAGQEVALFSRPFQCLPIDGAGQVNLLRLSADPNPAFDAYWDVVRIDDGVIERRQHMVPGSTYLVDVPQEGAANRLALALRGPYVGYWQGISFGNSAPPPVLMPGCNRLLVVVNGYPRRGDVYRNAFVHRRVKLYQAKGVAVDVVWVSSGLQQGGYDYDGVGVTICDAMTLRSTLKCSRHSAIAVHFLDAEIWSAIESATARIRTVVWLHGSEVQSSERRSFNYATEAERQDAALAWRTRREFWQRIVQEASENLHLVVVSRTFADEIWEDIGCRMADGQWSVIHNPIDTQIFAYSEKAASDRFNIVSVRPHASHVYANDIVAQTVLQLSRHPLFSEINFLLVGDGPLWEENFAGLTGFSNVRFHRGFLEPAELAALYAESGLFLCPSRGDTQGVSRGEAMASGMVAVTNKAGSIHEFASGLDTLLCEALDPVLFAQEIVRLLEDPCRFLALSKAARSRVLSQLDAGMVTVQELTVLGFADRKETFQ